MAVKVTAGWRIGLGALACALLVACSPKYDWRTVHSNEGAYAVDYPAKPTAEARPIAINGQRMPMTMQAASVDGTLFAIGVVELLNAARIQAAANFRPMELYTVAAFWYLVLVSIFSLGQAELERAVAVSERERPETLLSRALAIMSSGRRVV